MQLGDAIEQQADAAWRFRGPQVALWALLLFASWAAAQGSGLLQLAGYMPWPQPASRQQQAHYTSAPVAVLGSLAFIMRQLARQQARACTISLQLQLLLHILVLTAPVAALRSCPGKEGYCVEIATDGGADSPAYFLQSLSNPAVTEIVLSAPRYVLKPAAWSVYGADSPLELRRNVTVYSSVKPYGLMDFQLLENRVLIKSGVSVTFKSIVVQNVRKLGGFGLDFFMGELDSFMFLQDVVRVKLACQLPQDVLRASQTFTRVSPAFPPNNISLISNYCVDAAINQPDPRQFCFADSLHFQDFSFLSANNDPDRGNRFPGYVMYQQNTTRVCEHVITRQCLEEHGGDEELCLAMLVAESIGRSQDSGFQWTNGAIAGVAIAGAVVAGALLLGWFFRNHILLWCVRLGGRSLQDLENSSSSQWVAQHALPLALGHEQDLFIGSDQQPGYSGGSGGTGGGSIPPYIGRRAISQQVTLGVLLGAGSFGRVYKGRWHSSDVAIKIMSCTPDELPKVLREAEVMMSLSHPNIVRAFHASVWNPAEQIRALQAREARTSGDGRNPPVKKRSSTNFSVSGSQQQNSGGSNVSPLNSQSLPQLVAAPPAVNGTVAAATAAGVPAGSVKELDQLVIVPHVVHRHLSGSVALPDAASQPAAADARCWPSGPVEAVALPPDVSGPHTSSTSCRDVHQSGAAVSPLTPVTGGSSDHHPGPVGTASSTAASAWSSSQLHQRVLLAESASADRLAVLHDPGPHASGSISSAVAEAQESVADMLHMPQLQQQQHQLLPADAASAACATFQTAQPIHQQQAVLPHSLRQHLQGRLGRSNSSSSSGSGGGGSLKMQADSGLCAVTVATAPAPAAAASTGSRQDSGSAVLPVSQESDVQHSGSSAGARANRQAKQAQLQRQQQQQQGLGQVVDLDSDNGKVRRQEVQVWIVLELCAGGTLKDAVTSGKLRIDSKFELAKLMSRLLDSANGMAYLHSKGVMHGDLKAGNVLLQNNVHGTYGQVAKISDFGLAAVLLDGATHRSTASLGTITHCAPEVLRSGHMSPAADVYSFGIMMWELFMNKAAFQGMHYGAVVERVVVQKERPRIPDDMPEEFALLMQACWDPDPAKRPSFTQIVTCLELMLDNLASDAGSDSGDVAGEESGGMPTVSSMLARCSGMNAASAAVPLRPVAVAAPAVALLAAQQQEQATPPRAYADVAVAQVPPRCNPQQAQTQPVTPQQRVSDKSAGSRVHAEGSLPQSTLSGVSGNTGSSGVGSGHSASVLDANQFLQDL